MFKQFISFLKKEFYHILRDKKTIVILLIMPIVQIILFGFAISTEVNNTPLAIFDHNKTPTSQRLVQQIQDNPYFTIVHFINHENEIQKLFRKNKTKLVLVIPYDFEKKLVSQKKSPVQILSDATDPNEASTMNLYLSSTIINFQKTLSNSAVPMMISVAPRMLYNPELLSSYYFVPGVMALIMIIVCAMMTSVSIVKEKEMGTMEILLVSPIKPIVVILAKLTPYFVLSVVNIISILILAKFVLGLPIMAGSLWLIFLISMLYIIVSLALGLLISTLTNTQQVAMMISLLGLMLPNLLLSGMIFPRENMPLILQWISVVPPATWYITMLKDVMIKNLPFDFIIKPFLILLGMALFCIILSLKKFKTRLE